MAGRPSADAPRRAAPSVAACRAVPIGRVEHYFARAGAAVLRLAGPLAVGDVVHVRGHTTDFVLTVDRLERDGRPVPRADAGESVGLAVPERVRPGDRVERAVP
jgi:putative protease